ncbi:MAG: helicase, partial [Nakamurella sp.]
KLHNANGHSLHNHFILKSLDFVRPGGVVAVLTSSFTMDSTNPGARREMYAKADLLGAIRLPTGAHRRTAGTEALTDVLILRRREPGQELGEDSWLTTTPMRIDGELTERRVSRYFTEHPDRVLGQWTVGSGMYGAETLGVRADDLASTSARLSEALDRVVDEAITAGRAVTERPLDLGEAQAIAIAPEHGVWLGMVTAHPVSGFEITEATGAVDLEVPRSQHTELHALLSMRDMGRDLLAAEAASADDTPALDDLRTRLREAYTDYADRYGPINRVRVSVTSRIDPETGEAIVQRRRPPVMKWLRTDPFGSLIRALEVFDETAGTARPADLLTERVVLPRTPVMGVDTPDEALAVAMETDGELELSRVAELLDTTEEDARRQLGTLAFDDPDTGRLVPAAEYLSGNVRTKLDATTAAVDERPELAANVAALRQVLPAALGADEITPRIGAVWITPENHQDFLRQILNDPNARVIYGGGTDWEVKANAGSVAATSEWGTERRSAGDLMRALLEQAQIVVYDVDPVDNSRILNPTESEAAREKADAIQERFADWLWEDPARADRLVAEYNRRFNSLVLRDYTAEGSRLTLPGMVTTWDPWPHQRAAVARMLAEPTVGLFHEVGAGKTTEMVMGAMELRRLGMATKPVVVVPNHMLEQFSREWLQIYPQAQVLAASGDDLKAVNRRDFVARVATGDWDGVVMTRSAFGRLNLSVDAEAAYRTRELEEQRAQLETAKANGANLTVKRIEKKLLQLEEKLDQLTDLPRDPGLSFEDTGIDYLIIDEAHDYKNLRTISSIPDANIDGSGRATDLHMKVDLLRARHGERVLTMATATPIANSITEAHVMTRYLRPDLLDAAGISHFDQWAATFGQTVTELEMAPTGGGRYREKTRFASFTNVPEMLRIWSTFADVQTAEDLKLPTPDIRARPDGQRLPETVIVPPSPELLEFVQSLGARADALSGRAGKGEDNMLSITGDGRRAALDMR